MKPKNLPVSPDYGTMLYCPSCQGEYSATRGDYFMADPNETMICETCDRRLVLVQKQTTHRRIG